MIEARYAHEEPEEVPLLPIAENYLADKSASLSHDYGKNIECARIAIIVARIIISEGGNPQILRITNKSIDAFGKLKELIPRRYLGKVKWLEHTVCENDDFVYDPLVGKPLEKEEYLATIFMEPAVAEIDLTQDQVRDFVLGNKP